MTKIDEIKAFAEFIALPNEAICAALPLVHTALTAYAKEIEEIKAIAYQDRDGDRSVRTLIETIAEKESVHRDLAMLAVVLILGEGAREHYLRLGLAEDVYHDSMKDITIWTKTCIRETGHIGLYEFGWIMNFIRGEIVRLHRLEFHQISFEPLEQWQKKDLTVRRGEKVINIHVPEDGPLTHEDVLESYRRAYRHFGKTGCAAFVCHSWLLYPGMLEFLPEHSNIRAFAEDFHVIQVDHQKNSGDLWRVFGKRNSYDPAQLPRNNSLQRGMADYLAAHDNVTGAAYGIFAFDGNNII